ncbi:hypothetical protein H1R17_12055 [Flavobacterium sp. xlx-214]|uniref:hypothetical protein n=1 Tax=unclassified Flavobacterium TaxID=196869 RepID=UPI0013D6BEB4|nr:MULTISPECIES: hypothetical protein [unclassified Flavobacterium]MBA5794001.1 hypothetical protein [Flavobacterium sp. xlx-221]QMI83182.1 hypothetical protein H1R17_12055 [Flavobacterium sp. xlx-214]
MNLEIKSFIETLNQTQCKENIEFRSRFQKKWLKYQEKKCDKIAQELLKLMHSYQEFKNKGGKTLTEKQKIS